jgi:hypothetical protein
MDPNTEPQFNLDFNQTEEYTCPECKGKHFEQVYAMRKISAILAPTGEESYIPVPVYACTNCHHVPEQFGPKSES